MKTFCHRTLAVGGHRVARWLESRQPAELWLGKHCVLAAWLGLSLAIVSQPHGSGISVCWLSSATGISCPGCGVTRSMSCAIHGMFQESFQYHPMGCLILALFVLTAAYSLLPSLVRNRLALRLQRRAGVFNMLYLAFVTAFISYGLVRSLTQLNL